MSTKEELRKKLKMIRDNMPEEECLTKSELICEHILKSEVYQTASSVLLFFAINHEVSLNQIVDDALAHGKRVFFPKSNQDGTMEFFQIISLSQLSPGYMNIPEPTGDTTRFDDESGLILVPALAFNSSRHRIGYGKGFYDRYLKNHSRLYSVGVGYQFQMNQDFITSNFDFPVKEVISEVGRNL